MCVCECEATLTRVALISIALAVDRIHPQPPLHRKTFLKPKWALKWGIQGVQEYFACYMTQWFVYWRWVCAHSRQPDEKKEICEHLLARNIFHDKSIVNFCCSLCSSDFKRISKGSRYSIVKTVLFCIVRCFTAQYSKKGKVTFYRNKIIMMVSSNRVKHFIA